MNFVSLQFLAFVALLVPIYYIMPRKIRWVVLLIASSVFYIQGGISAFVMVLLTTGLAYAAALLIEKTQENYRKCCTLLIIALILVLGILVLFKVVNIAKLDFAWLIVPMGVSYYTFSLVSYILDVYWRKDKAEHNYFKLLLFVLYFPKIVQGPISRRKYLAPQLLAGNRFSYQNLCFGLQLSLWGFFKKIVIADRASIFVNGVFGDFATYKNAGSILIVATALSVIQIYCDFSGYMDIVLGVSQMFGVKMEQNFNHPFFAKTAAEFWQRWHMTLSGWFKDYLFLPVSRSSIVRKISKAMGKKFGATVRKNTIVVIASFVVWMSTGIWHGTGITYVAWGLYWFVLVCGGTVFAPLFTKMNKLLHINTESKGWKVFQMLRTFVFFCGGRLLTVPGLLWTTKEAVKSMFLSLNFGDLFNGTLYNCGLNEADFITLLVAMLLLLLISLWQEKGSVRETIAKWNPIIRWAVYAFGIFVVLFWGVYGTGYSTSGFMYQNF